jgi:hypothetical protein
VKFVLACSLRVKNQILEQSSTNFEWPPNKGCVASPHFFGIETAHFETQKDYEFMVDK